jgi:Mce-associated membrane protein
MPGQDEPTEPAATESTVEHRRQRRLVLTVAVAAAAALFAVVAGALWFTAAHSSGLRLAEARDAAVDAARVDVAAVNTLDYRSVRAGLARWSAVSTGALRQQLTQVDDTEIKTITDAKMVTTATVVAVAATAVDPDRGTATVLASVNVRKQPATGAAVTTRNRFELAMQRVGDQWKLADVKIVAVQLR